MLDIITMGEALIDLLADRIGVGLTQTKSFTWAAGGAPANVAVAAAKLGLKTGFVSKLGNDPFGQYIQRTLQSNGVNTDNLKLTDEARTALAFVALPSPTSPQFIFYRNPSADMLMRAEELDQEYLRDTSVFHFGSITLIDEPCCTATLEAAKIAKASGAMISFDANYRPALWPATKAQKRILEALPLCDLVKVNDSEAAIISGHKDTLTAAKAILTLGPKAVLVTLGAEGSLYVTPRYNGQVPSFRVVAVDATGCGDGFMAGAIKGILDAGDLPNLGPLDYEDILRYANAVGALTATKKGGIPALPTAAQVSSFLETVR